MRRWYATSDDRRSGKNPSVVPIDDQREAKYRMTDRLARNNVSAVCGQDSPSARRAFVNRSNPRRYTVSATQY